MEKSPKLKVGLVFDDSLDSNDGVAGQVKQLGVYLASCGHHVFYMCGETKMAEFDGDTVYSLAKNINIRFNGNRLSMPIWSSRRKIKQVLSDEQPDVLHVMMPYSPFLAQRAIRLARRQLAIVGSFHILPVGFLAAIGARLLGIIQWRSLKRFGAMSATSQKAAEFAKASMRINATVIPNTVDTARFVNKAHPINSRIVFLGRLVERKGCRQLIEAFGLLVQIHPTAELVIAGDGLQRAALEKLVRQKGLSSKVKFLGYIDEADKPALLGSAAVACFPSLGGESFGVVLIEAMAAGAGVILAGDNPGYASVLGQRPELLVNPSDKKAFADRLKELLNDDRLRQDLHSWQQTEVKQYDINVVGRQVLGLYGEAIARLGKKSHNKAHE